MTEESVLEYVLLDTETNRAYHLAEIHAAHQWLWTALDRWMAAQQAGIETIPCWIKDLTDEQAYMELVLCNTQSELHPLEEGKHAAESGMDLKAYAEQAGKKYTTLYDKVKAFRVLAVTHMRNEDARDSWRNLAEIHAAPQWLWTVLANDLQSAEP